MSDEGGWSQEDTCPRLRILLHRSSFIFHRSDLSFIVSIRSLSKSDLILHVPF